MAWLTPDAAGDITVSRRFFIPGDHLYLFMGALYALTIESNWEQFGTMTPDEIVQEVQIILSTFTDSDLVGTTFTYITDDPPVGSLPLEGGTFNDADYPALAAKLNPIFSNGDGTFTLPDARGRVMVGSGTGTGLSTYAVGDVFGEEAHSLTGTENGTHDHLYGAVSSDLLVVAPGDAPSTTGIAAPTATGSSGAGSAHENRQPSLALPMAVWYQ